MRNLSVNVKHKEIIFELVEKITNLLCTYYKYVKAMKTEESLLLLTIQGIVFLHKS
jgi:hypothetical protein